MLAGPDTIESILNRLEGVVPEESSALIEDSLTRAIENQSGGLVLIIIGFLLALWEPAPFLLAAGVVLVACGAVIVFVREDTSGERRYTRLRTVLAAPWRVVRRERNVRRFLVANTHGLSALAKAVADVAALRDVVGVILRTVDDTLAGEVANANSPEGSLARSA